MSDPIILFDGVCNFCSDSVKFVIDRNSQSNLRFCQLQSTQGKQFLAEYGQEDLQITSMVLIADDKIYLKSSAALKITAHMDKPWPLLTIFILVPKWIRNRVYDWIGNNRYRWFGKKEVCWIPDDDIKKRFIE